MIEFNVLNLLNSLVQLKGQRYHQVNWNWGEEDRSNAVI